MRDLADGGWRSPRNGSVLKQNFVASLPRFLTGVKLAAISGVNGPFSDVDVRRVRRLALDARSKRVPKRENANVPKRIVARRGTVLAPSKKQVRSS